MTNSQFAFILGVALSSAMLFGVIIMYKKQYKELSKRYAHSTNDNDFLHAELMMIASRTDPNLVKQMKQSDDYKRMVKQYQANKSCIEVIGRRP